MSKHVVFNGVDDGVKARLQEYWQKNLPRLHKLLRSYSEDLREIRLTVYQHEEKSNRRWYEVRAVIHLPTGTLVAEADEADPMRALHRVGDALVLEAKKHKEHVRHDYVFKRKIRNREDLSAAGPLLKQDVEHGRWEDFFRLMRPLLGFLRDHARRELRILELNGLLHRGEVTVADLLDEVLAMAWERFKDRPRKTPLDLWLIDVLQDVLDKEIKEEPRPHASLEQRVPKEDADRQPEKRDKEWWEELLGYDEILWLEDLIADTHTTDAWQQLEAEEQRDELLSLLGKLPPAQKQAFLLHALENYDTAEIAMLQERPEEQIKADIESARRTLRESLLASGYLEEKPQYAATAAHEAGREHSEIKP